MKRFATVALLAVAGILAAVPLFDTAAATTDANFDPTVVFEDVPRGTTLDQLPQLRYELALIDPGIAPEGDYTGGVAFTSDGDRVLLTSRLSDMVTVYDWSTMQPLANIPVGEFPRDIAVTDDYAVVPCTFSDEVYVIDLDDYSVAATFATAEQPVVVRVSPDGNWAYVACDIDDVLEVIDLATLTHTSSINGFYIALYGFWGSLGTGRTGYSFTNFEALADNTTLAVGDWDTQVQFWDTTTGTMTGAVALDDIRKVHLSGDGAQLVAVSNTHIHRIDLASQTATGTVSFDGATISGHYEAGVTMDGAKAYVGISGNQSAIARFDTQDYATFSQTYTAFWLGMNADRTIAISGQYRLSLIDMETESVIGQCWGIQQDFGAVSPVNNRIVAHHSVYEGITFFDFTDTGDITYCGRSLAGEVPEGDTPLRLALLPDGNHALAVGPIGTSMSVVNMNTGDVEEVVQLDVEPRDVAVTPDGDWAVVTAFSYMTEYSDGLVYIIDLSDYSVAATIDVGQRPFNLTMSADGSRAYVANIQGNTISVIDMNGAASSELAQIPCGVIGVVYTCYGTFSGIELSPDGSCLLVCASFDDQVKVIDTNAMQVVASLPTGDFPLKAAFTPDGQYALVTNCFGNTATICEIDGAASQVIGTINPGDKPFRCATNPVTGDIGVVVCNDAKVIEYALPSGAQSVVYDYSANESYLYMLRYDAAGNPIVLGANSLHYGADEVETPGAAWFVWRDEGPKALACTPSPDQLHLVSWADAGQISGVVDLAETTDDSGALIEILELGATATSDPDGDYLFSAVPQGTYTMRANKNGWLEETVGAVSVTAGEMTTVDFTLGVFAYAPTTLTAAYTTSDDVILQWTMPGDAQIDPEGFTGWMFAPDDVGDPELWTELFTAVTAAYAILDITLSEQTQFAVTADYWWGESSEAAISNVLDPLSADETPPAPVTALLPNTPNPFNPSTTVQFSLAQAGTARLEVFDVRGRRVTVLADERFDVGEHTLTWDATGMASGIYLLRLQTDGRSLTRRMALLK
ncbi:MAG: beta-propeller fold lactonase family protein [Candidatus Cloacimonetes bacterium]|nr:beta-propeller fold lactonase family protein [Candidatus Cloacimonadota bacterium]